ncbi:MAG: AtpZ/AtpI family protein [Bacteroidota bacterium]
MFSQGNQENGRKNSRNKQKGIKKESRKDSNPLREYAKYSALGFQMMVIILLGLFGGMKLDEWAAGINFPLFTLLGVILGVVLGIYYAIKDFIKFK